MSEGAAVALGLLAFNRTKLELKRRKAAPICYISETFNRTKLELKHRCTTTMELYAEEGRQQELVEIIRKHPTHIYNSYNEGNLLTMISYIIASHPAESFQIIGEKVEAALESGRGRNVYAAVTKWLQRMQEIEGYQTETRLYMKALLKKHFRLRALKDEMRQGGIVF